jgi:uncharacterized protein
MILTIEVIHATGKQRPSSAVSDHPMENPMLALRPSCECCDRDLPPASRDAMICTFECTFCADCAGNLAGICPNCAGELVRRPIRPAAKLAKNPPSTTRIFKPEGCANALPL